MRALIDTIKAYGAFLLPLGTLGASLVVFLSIAGQLPALLSAAATYVTTITGAIPVVLIGAYYAQADTFFPVTEGALLFSSYLALKSSLTIVRMVKSLIPTVS